MTEKKMSQQTAALEEAFYRTTDGLVAVEVHEKLTLGTTEDVLAEITGIADREVLGELRSLEITPRTLMAFSLFPSIHVAWADGKRETKEKAAILNSADRLGIASDSAAFKLLDSWLSREPSEELLLAWKSFIHAVGPELSSGAFQEQRSAAMKRARTVAEAAGGFLGFRPTSASENAAIAELEAAFTDILPQNPETRAS